MRLRCAASAVLLGGGWLELAAMGWSTGKLGSGVTVLLLSTMCVLAVGGWIWLGCRFGSLTVTVMGALPVGIWILGGGALVARSGTMALVSLAGCGPWTGSGGLGLGTAGVGVIVSGAGGALGFGGLTGVLAGGGASELEPAPGSCPGWYWF